MRRFLLVILSATFILVPLASAQTPTLVTGVVKDTNGIPYANAKVAAQLVGVPPTQTATILVNGIPVQIGGQQNASTDANGNLTMNLFCNSAGGGCSVISPSGTQWQFTVNENGDPSPLGTGPQVCTATLTITGASQSITSSFNACPLLARVTATVAPSGSSGQVQINNGGVSAGTPCVTAPNISAGPVVTCDNENQGPNPWVDIRFFGAVAANPNTTPNVPGVTANCNTATPSQVTLSSASIFKNGNGIDLYGCGAATTLTTPAAPTVTPSISTAGTNTLLVGNSAAGAVTYNYKVVLRDRQGGLTAASPAGSTATGQATLGSNGTLNITSIARSGQAMTFTLASPHALNTACTYTNCGVIFVSRANALSDITFSGWYSVTSAPDSTHVVANNWPTTALGAPASATGGAITFYTTNHICWTDQANAVEAYLYGDRAVPGVFALLGASFPNSSGGTRDLCIDDLGSPFMDNQSFPPFVPTTAPSVATAQNLQTTITAGGGSTTLTLANPVQTTVPSATAVLDAGPGILAAAAAVRSSGGCLTIPVDPSGNPFVINTWTDIGNSGSLPVPVCQLGQLYLNDTLEDSAPGAGGVKWMGEVIPQAQSTLPPASWGLYSVITVNGAHPGLFFSNPQQFGFQMRGVQLNTVPVNGTLAMVLEGGFDQTVEHVNYSTGFGVNDFISMGLMLKAGPGQSNSKVILNYIGCTPGGGGDAASYTPCIYGRANGLLTMQNIDFVHRGTLFTGSPVKIGVGGVAYLNGGGTPIVTTLNGFGGVDAGTIFLDTVAMPCITTLSTGNDASTVTFENGPCAPSLGLLPISGHGVYSSGANNYTFANSDTGPINGLSYPGAGSSQATARNFNGIFSVGEGLNSKFFVQSAPPSLNSASVSAGGSISVASHPFQIVPVWQDSGEGKMSNTVTATTTGGNQTVTLNWTQVPGNPLLIRIYDGCSRISATAAGNATSIVLTSEAFVGATCVSIPGSGPTMLMPGVQGLAASAEKFGTPPVDAGFAATLTGTGACATGSLTTQTGGAMSGTVTCTGTTGASTLVIAPGGTAAAHGFACSASDETTNNPLRQTAHGTTSCTLSGTVNQNDVIIFEAHYAF